METNFKLKYNFWAINFLIFVIFFTIGIENTIAQDDNSNISDLEIVNIYFPDTYDRRNCNIESIFEK